MNATSVFISVAVAAILVIAAVYVLDPSMAKTAETSTTTPPATTTSTPTKSAQPQMVKVSMPNGVSTSQTVTFQPANITLVIGVNNTVTWTNSDSAPHTVTATSVPTGAAKFNSGNLNPGATFTYTFNVPGTYKYDCTYHFWMQGTIVVEDGA